MRQKYKDLVFRSDTRKMIEILNSVIDEYLAQGYTLTVRQLYYQMVARGYIPNTEKSYKRTTSVVNDARVAGLMDWDAIEDRTRSFVRMTRWASPASILRAASATYHMDMWSNQDYRVFCIVEKEALAGVLEGVCHRYDVPLLAARGYPSGTVLREFVELDILPAIEEGQEIRIIHLGDHDPSGIDMSRDLIERIEMFAGEESGSVSLKRIALSMAQVQAQNPPPNPAKTTDSRFKDYRKKYGSESWELDALSPAYLNELVGDEIQEVIDDEAWEEREQLIADSKKKIVAAAAKLEV